MFERQINEIVSFAKKMAYEGIAASGDTLSMRVTDGMLVSDANKNLGELTEFDVRFVSAKDKTEGAAELHRAVYTEREDILAIITNHAPYCGIAGNNMKKLPAALDDMAQIVGPTAKVAPSGEIRAVLKTLKGRNACLVKGDGAIATGRTVDEAFTGCMVLEKGAKAYVEATVLGGAKIIPYFEGVLMRFVYKTKYSKKNQEEKMEEMKA